MKEIQFDPMSPELIIKFIESKPTEKSYWIIERDKILIFYINDGYSACCTLYAFEFLVYDYGIFYTRINNFNKKEE